MVQSWVLGSNTSPAASVRTGASFKAKSDTAASSGNRWRMARMIFFALAFVLLFTGFTFMRTFASQQHVQPASVTERIISVDAGDTLWTLAASVKKASMDTREAVYELQKRNGLKSVALTSGQVLIVPDSILP
ncbi:LysM peptidoglycan-binding domain-containing protein [Cohnella pontilimi]|nr:LysM peptidoglycan-binding domain-containing protein [Cohnella pontilimi]